MSIPHVDRTITHVDRTEVPAPPARVFRELIDLEGLLGGTDELRIESWPDGGLVAPGAAFWAVHWATSSSGHAVEYRVTGGEPPTSLALRARSDLYEATHRIAVDVADRGSSEVAWSVTLDPDRPATQQLVEDASMLATTALQGLQRLVGRETEPDRARTR